LIEIAVPGRGSFKLEHLVLDLNGTLALDGKLLEGMEERLEELSTLLDITIATADTHGTARTLEKSLGLRVERIEAGNEDIQKLTLVQRLGPERTVCVGNGSNDVLMLKGSALGICILGREGASAEAMASSDLVIADIKDALDLLLTPRRLIATLRK
jgi:P-type E1-E2 ATPase